MTEPVEGKKREVEDLVKFASRGIEKLDKRSVLKELESIMLFDQSMSSKWPRVRIYVEAGGTDPYQDQSFQVYPNGRTYNIERSAEAPVPPEVVDALHACMTAIMVRDPKANNGYISRDVLRFPFRIVDSDSQRRYDNWKIGLELLRHVHEDVERIVHADGKVSWKTLDRYLEEDKVQEAISLIVWVRGENERVRRMNEANQPLAA